MLVNIEISYEFKVISKNFRKKYEENKTQIQILTPEKNEFVEEHYCKEKEERSYLNNFELFCS